MIEFTKRTLEQAKAEVEAVLLAESKKRGEGWDNVSVELWYGGSLDKMNGEGNVLVGIRVCEIGFSRRGPTEGSLSGFCGCSGSDTDSLASLTACAAAERAIMARCCYYESSDENQQYDVERFDEMLIEANW